MNNLLAITALSEAIEAIKDAQSKIDNAYKATRSAEIRRDRINDGIMWMYWEVDEIKNKLTSYLDFYQKDTARRINQK